MRVNGFKVKNKEMEHTHLNLRQNMRVNEKEIRNTVKVLSTLKMVTNILVNGHMENKTEKVFNLNSN